MKNNIKNLAIKNWHWIVFFVFSFLALAFLIFQPGIWAFTDSGFYYSDISQAQKIALSKLGLFSNTDGFYLGFDNSAGAFGHLMVCWYQLLLTFIFGAYFGQIIYYFIYYFLSFYFGLLLLRKIFFGFSDKSIRIGAIFLTFNPFSLLISTLFAISYIYCLSIVFLYVFLQYLRRAKTKYLFFSLFTCLYLFSYLRLAPIVVLLLASIIWIFYDRKYFILRRWIIFLILLFLAASPYLVGNFFAAEDSGNVVNNYQQSFNKYEEANYNFKKSFINSLAVPGGFSPSSLSFYYNNRGIPGFSDNFAVSQSFEFYKLIQLIFNAGILIFTAGFLKEKKSTKILSLCCFLLFLNTAGLFFNENLFTLIHKSILVFLYNDYGFLQFIQSFLYAFLVIYAIDFFEKEQNNKKALHYAIAIVFIYLLINISPFLFGHYGFKKISDIPQNYQYIFNDEKDDLGEATIFAPYHWLKLNWSPYFLDFNSFHYSKYKSLIAPNLRLVNSDFVKFYNQIYDNLGKDNISNLSVFNIKNIFVFKDVVDSEKQIDSYQVSNTEYNSKKINSNLQDQKDLKAVEENENFSHYRFIDADDYDFLIYSPKTLVDIRLENFYEKKLDLSSKPLFFDRTKLNNINIIRDINFKLNSPHVSFKVFSNNPNKYYVKVSVEKIYPFLLQLNQTFSKDWQVYFISSSEWEKEKCATEAKNFSITENDYCVVFGTPIDFKDLSLFSEKRLKPENHFLGNIANNTFLITKEDIPQKFYQGNDLYMIIYFRKQIYYLMSLILSSLVFVSVFVVMILEIVRNKKKL